MSRPSHYNSRYKHGLSPQQQRVVELIAAGKTNAEIAEKLELSLDGAKWHVREALAKLGVETREEAAQYWRDYQRPRAWREGFRESLGPGLWQMAAGASAFAAVAVVAVAGAWSFRGGVDDSAEEVPPACQAEDMRMDTNTEQTPDGIRVTLLVGLRDPDWYEGAFKLFRLSDRKVESPCRLETRISVGIQLLGPLADAPPSATAPIVPLGIAPSINGNPAEVPVALTLRRGMQNALLVAEFSNWCRDDAALGIQFGVPDAFVPGAYQGLGAPLPGLPACDNDASPPELSVEPAR